MSFHENIARLTGQLNFDVDTGGLSKFQQMLKRTQQMMMQVSKEAEALQQKLNLKLGVKSSADKAKLDTAVRHNLDRELRLERAAQQARSETFKAELLQQKLVSAGTKENAALQTQLLKDKIQQAVLDAKSAKASQEKLKAQGVALRNEQSIEAAKARQSRLESVLQAQRAKTVASQQKALQSLSATQRMELGLQEARTRSQRALARFTEQQAAMKVKSERATEKHQQQQQRFQWQQARQQVWEANRNKPEPSTGFLGLGTAGLAVGGATAGVALIVGAINALGDRIGATQDRVSNSQSWANTIEQAGGKNPANQKFAKDQFLRISESAGTSIDLDAAKAYRTFVSGAMSRGLTLSKAIQQYETQQQAFRAAGMPRTEQERATLQLGQVRSKGHGDTEDFNTLSESAPLLAQAIREAWAIRTHFKGKPDQLNGAFVKALPKGGYLAADADAGMARYVAQNQEALKKQSQSIDANQTRLENQKLQQQLGLDQNPELINAINDRIKSEMELNDALKPLKETAIATDTALNNLAASFLRWTIGKDQTSTDAANKVELLNPEKTAIDPQALSGVEVDSSKAKAQDPVDRFYNWLMNKPDPADSPANKLKADESAPLGFLKKMDFSKAWNVPEIGDDQFHSVVRDVFDVQRLHDSYRSKGLGQFDPRDMTVSEWNLNKPIDMKEPETNITNNVTNNPTINVNVTTDSNASPQEIARVAADVVDERLQRVYSQANTNLVETK